MFGQSLLSGAFGTALVPGDNFGIGEYLGNAATNTLGGKIKGAALFNGSNTGMVVPGNMGTLLGNEFSVSFWFYAPTSFPSSGYPTFVSLYGYPGYGSAYGWSIEYPNSGKIMFYWVSSSAVGNNIQSSALTPGKWCHVIVTKDSNSANIYINNVLDNATTSVSSNAMWYNGFEQLTIGCKRNAGAGGATSSHISDPVDQMRIFTSVLTSDERAAVYAEDSSTANTLNFPTGAGCVAAYQFDNNVNGPLNTDKISTCDFPYGAGCQFLYEFDNSVIDTCGTYNGTANSITYVNGVFNKAASFDGTNSYINTGLTLGSGTQLSWSAWIKTSNTKNTYLTGDFDSGGANANHRFSVRLYSQNFQASVNNAAGGLGTTITFGTFAHYGEWAHLVVTVNGTSVKGYVNGSQLGSTGTSSQSLAAGAYSLVLGCYGATTGAAQQFDGSMDQVRLFNTELTQSQVTELARGAGSAKNAEDINNNIAFNGFSNFKPDFVWNKATNQAYNYSVYDSIRGGQFQLATNSTNVPWNSSGSGGIRKFQDTGFTMGSGENQNSVSGTNAVSWMWKAGADHYGGLFNGDVNTSYELNNWLELNGPLITGSADFGVSCWVKFHSITAGATGVVGNFQTGITPQAGWAIAHQSGTPFQFWADGTANSQGGMAQATTTPIAHKWYHVVGTYDGSNVKIYVNGTLENTVAYTSTPLSTASNFQIGRWYGNYNDYYTNGVIDQVRIFDSAPTQTEVTALYNESAANNNTLNFPAGADCIAAFTLNNTPNSVLNEADLSTVNFPSGTTGAALYQFNDSVNGIAGPNPTTSTNLTFAPGVFGKSLNFNGSNSVWQSTNQIIEAQQDFTIAMWVKVDAFATSTYLWTSYATGDCGISMAGNAGSNYFSFHKYNNTQSPVYVSLDSPNVATLGKWYHLCGTFSTTTGMAFYIDGNLVGTDSTTWVPQDHGAYSDSIGCYGYTPSGNRANFTGQIDQFRAYQEVLTASQVRELVRGNYNLTPYGNFDPGTPAESYIKSGYLGRNNNGNIEGQVSANQDYGFSIVTYAPNDTVGMTVGHGLKKSPELVITKRIDSAQDWGVYTNVSTGNSTTNWLVLNSTAAYGSGSYMTLNSSTLELPQTGAYWSTGTWQVAYCWHSVPKYSKIGSYTGNGSTTGPIVNTGFKPAWLMVKNTANGVTSWGIVDSKRSPVNPRNLYLFADWNGAESSSGDVDFNDTGFQIKSSSNFLNQSGNEILYMAFAE